MGYAQGERTTGVEEVLELENREEISIAEIEETLRTTEFYTVHQTDAHAWPEIYFPGIGWVEFEPTANQAPLVRSSGEELIVENNEEEALTNLEEEEEILPEDELAPEENLNEENAPEQAEEIPLWLNRSLWLSILIAGAGLAAMAFSWRTARSRGLQPLPVLVERGLIRFNITPPNFIRIWSHYASLSPLGKAYIEINRALKRLGEPARPHVTPAERADALVELLPPLEEPIAQLRDEYQTGTYSLENGDHETAQQASREIRMVSYWAWFQKLLSRWQTKEEDRSDLPTLLKEQELQAQGEKEEQEEQED